MIVVRIVGGLGNQMFQYAAGKALARYHGTELKIDTFWFCSEAPRAYKLGMFSIEDARATQAEVERAIGRPQGEPWCLLWRLGQHLKPYYRRAGLYERPQRGFDPSFFQTPPDLYLSGFWQSERYFESVRDELRGLFRWSAPMPMADCDMADRIMSCNAVSLHVRRGDYITDPVARRQMGPFDEEYYYRAAAYVAERVADPTFFIFSDEPEWCQANLKLPHRTVYVSGSHPRQDYDDMRLMSMCRHHVMPNSTFSWWGAWLGEHAGQIAVAPARWFHDTPEDAPHIVPERWVRL